LLTALAFLTGLHGVLAAPQKPAQLLGRNGSVDVDVPDFSGNTVQLSGVILSADPTWRLAAAEGLADLLPVPPTTVREFEATTSVRASARVYDRSREPAAVRATITDEQGSIVVGRQTALDAARFTRQGAADYQVNLPIASLKPGRYLLTLEAAAKRKTATRQVRFAVK
jgi:hypothetical protein